MARHSVGSGPLGRFRPREPSRIDMTLKRVAAVAVLLLGAIASGCGSSGRAPRRAGDPSAFAWLRPAPAPSAWPLARLSGTVAMAYPPSWHRIESDPGTVSAALVVARTGFITEYLNATPKQANETLQNWASFRTAHNQEEGDRHEQVLAAARDLRFRDGRGSCVIDRYRTTRTSYEEIACLVQAPTRETVVVAAALASTWAQDSPALERAVSAFVA